MAEEQDAPGFISRWSRLKRQGADGSTAEEAEPEATGSPDQNTDDPEALANREAAEALDLDRLDFSSDFSIFMKKGVPLALRNRALRKLWTTSPVLANLDGLNDYEQTDVDRTPIDIKSLWQVGKGYAREAQRIAGSLDEGADDGSPSADEADQEITAISPEPRGA